MVFSVNKIMDFFYCDNKERGSYGKEDNGYKFESQLEVKLCQEDSEWRNVFKSSPKAGI